MQPPRLWVALGVALSVLAVDAEVPRHELLNWDDRVMVAENPWLEPPSVRGTLELWRRPYMDMYIPVTYTALSALSAVSPRIQRAGAPPEIDPWPFHAASVALHAASALLVLAILSRLFGAGWAAGAGALLFALHPVQVEAVCWLSGIKDLLFGCFSLLAIERYVAFAQAAAGKGTPRRDYAIASVACLLAFLSKPTAVVVPLVLLLLDLLVLGRSRRDAVRALAPWFVFAALGLVLTRWFQPATQTDAGPAWARPFVAGDALAFYLGKLVFPFHLAPDYGRNPTWVLGHAWGYATWIVPAALAVLLGLGRRRRPELAAAGGIFAAGVAPVLGLAAFDTQRYSTVGDHYLYLSMLGPALALAWLLSRARDGRAWTAAWILLAVLGVASRIQTRVWENDLTLYDHTLAVNPQSFMARGNRGVALQARGRTAEALADFTEAVRMNPLDMRSRFNLGTALDALDRTEEAIGHLEEAVRLSPTDRPSRENLGIALLRADRPADAEEHLREAIAIEPSSFLAHYYLAGALDRLGRTDEMLDHLREAVRLNPRFAPARKDLAEVLKMRAAGEPR